MQDTGLWRELFRSEDLMKARAIATCVAAMEFEARLGPAAPPIRAEEGDGPGDPPYVVEVMMTDWPQLAEVLEEIVAEQEDFDDALERWQCRAAQSERRVLLAMIIIVGALAALGVIEL